MTIPNIRRPSITDGAPVAASPPVARFPVTLAGRPARRALASGARGRVRALFRRSFYVQTDDGGLVCLGPRGLGAGPLNALCDLPGHLDWQGSGLRVDASACVGGEILYIGDGFAFSLGDAVEWRPATPSPDWTRHLPVNLAALADMASDPFPPDGLGHFIPGLIHGTVVETDGNELLRAAAPGVAALRHWLDTALSGEGGSCPEPPNTMAELIGLGPGLTPSGDDLLGGAMVALHAFGRSEVAETLAAWALPLARAGTNAISNAHLACAAEGEGAGALHDMMVVLAAVGAPGLDTALAAIDAIGHCSGWDALTGAVVVGTALAH